MGKKRSRGKRSQKRKKQEGDFFNLPAMIGSLFGGSRRSAPPRRRQPPQRRRPPPQRPNYAMQNRGSPQKKTSTRWVFNGFY
jgi:hypothetical protein